MCFQTRHMPPTCINMCRGGLRDLPAPTPVWTAGLLPPLPTVHNVRDGQGRMREGGVWNGANYRQLLPPEAGGLLYLSFRPVWCIHLHTCPPSCHPEHTCAGGMCTTRVPRMDGRLFRGCFVAQDERRQRWNNLTKCIKKAKLLIKLCQEGWT